MCEHFKVFPLTPHFIFPQIYAIISPMNTKHYVYILKCADGTFYTGWSTDPIRRTKAHNSGKGAKYTRSRRPVTLVYTEEYGDKSTALKREYAIKQLSRKDKEELIADYDKHDNF